VTWRFRASADAYRRVAGIDPAEGTASLVVRAGRAVALGFVTDGEAVARRVRQVDAALSARLAAAYAALRPPAGPEPRRLLGLAGAAALAGPLALLPRPCEEP
jgi:hypothetical protein